MDEITNKAIQDAIELLSLGKHQEAQNILAPLIEIILTMLKHGIYWALLLTM